MPLEEGSPLDELGTIGDGEADEEEVKEDMLTVCGALALVVRTAKFCVESNCV